jgi:23S rRNA pseudouridine2605 synthase
MSIERVQKILAQAGIASRRKAEELIIEGLVTINGKVAKLGDKADRQKDSIKVSGKLLQRAEAHVYLAFHKPRGVISMFGDPQGRPTLSDYLGKIRVRLFPIGRLDFNSEGLILLTNDGDFAEKLQKRDDIPRVYHVKVKGHPTPEMVQRLTRGARHEGRLFKPHSVRVAQELANKARIEVVLIGSTVDLKAYFEMKGFLVEKMVRTSIGHLTLRNIEPGHYRHLKKSQVEALLLQPELGMRKLDELAKIAPKLRPKREASRERDRDRASERPRSKEPAKIKIRPRPQR